MRCGMVSWIIWMVALTTACADPKMDERLDRMEQKLNELSTSKVQVDQKQGDALLKELVRIEENRVKAGDELKAGMANVIADVGKVRGESLLNALRDKNEAEKKNEDLRQQNAALQEKVTRSELDYAMLKKQQDEQVKQIEKLKEREKSLADAAGRLTPIEERLKAIEEKIQANKSETTSAFSKQLEQLQAEKKLLAEQTKALEQEKVRLEKLVRDLEKATGAEQAISPR